MSTQNYVNAKWYFNTERDIIIIFTQSDKKKKKIFFFCLKSNARSRMGPKHR
jgi:hypothetical protein